LKKGTKQPARHIACSMQVKYSSTVCKKRWWLTARILEKLPLFGIASMGYKA
jgi:hypothetical protein